MPSVSEKQRRYLFAHFGAAWVKRHGFDVLESAHARSVDKHKKRGGRHKAHRPS